MTIWEAYCDIKLRNIFKHEYLTAQGYTPSKAQDIMTKYKNYIDRFNGIPDIIEIRQIESVADMMEKLDFIFNNKWQNHIKDSYRILPDIFRQYGLFLKAENTRQIRTFIADVIPNVTEIKDKNFGITEYEKPYIKEGKLTIISNPNLIVLLKDCVNSNLLATSDCINVVHTFYNQSFPLMSDHDWQKLIEKLFDKDKKKESSKTGAKKTKIHLVMNSIVDVVVQSSVALNLVCNYIGKEKISKLKIELKGMSLVTRNVPFGKEKFYCPIEDGWFLNVIGDTKDKVKIIRFLGMYFHIDIKTEIVA